MDTESDYDRLSDEQLLALDRLASEFEAAWKTGTRPTTETRLTHVADELRAAALAELLPVEIAYRRRSGDVVTTDELLGRFPEVSREWLRALAEAEQDADARANQCRSELGTAGVAADEDVPERFGDYRILSRIGGGGMGTVYKAVHERMGRVVALKLLRRDIRDDGALLQRFDREVRAAARLSHPNIVTALDAREHEGRLCLITEFVDGCDLQETVRQNGPLPRALAVDCILQVAKGLAYAHRQGVIHRDIKPANLLLGVDATVKILDMGLARFEATDGAPGEELTKSGVVMGTAAYMAPEQARDTRRADARSDLYSLGCTLYFLLHGRPLFSGETMVDTILSHVSQPAPSLGTEEDVPPALEAAFRRLVAKNPADRFASAEEVLAALAPFGSDAWPATGEELQVHEERSRNDESKESRGEAPAASPPTATLHERLETLAGSADVAMSVADSAVTPAKVARPTGFTSPPPLASGAPASRRRGLVALLIAASLIALAMLVMFPRSGKQEPSAGDYALEFNGRSSYLAAPALEPEAGQTYTIEVLVRPRHFQTSNVVSWLGPDWMALYVSDDGRWGAARRWRGRSTLISARPPATLDTLVHVAAVFDEDRLQLFVDGRLAETDGVEHTLLETSGGLYVGGVPFERLPESRFFDGQVDAVRISRGRRYQESFAPPRVLDSDDATVACFPFGEGQGSTTRSSDPQAWEATLLEATWRGAARMDGP